MSWLKKFFSSQSSQETKVYYKVHGIIAPAKNFMVVRQKMEKNLIVLYAKYVLVMIFKKLSKSKN